jgi:hypothetical protein
MSFGKFDRWETTSGANLGAVLQVSESWAGVSQRWSTGNNNGGFDYLDAGSENRGRVWWDPEGFTVAIKPKFSTSKILLMGIASVCASTADSYNIHGRIVRNGTPVGNGILAQGNHTHAAHAEVRTHGAADYASNQRMHYHFLDTPGITGIIEYRFQLCHTYSSNYNLYVNRENDLSWESGTSSHFLAMEIQA